MRIMFIIPRISGGGAEKVLTALASRLAGKHEIFLVTTIMKDGTEEYPLSDKVKSDPVLMNQMFDAYLLYLRDQVKVKYYEK